MQLNWVVVKVQALSTQGTSPITTLMSAEILPKLVPLISTTVPFPHDVGEIELTEGVNAVRYVNRQAAGMARDRELKLVTLAPRVTLTETTPAIEEVEVDVGRRHKHNGGVV